MDVLLERVKQLCKKRSITVSELEDALDLPPNTVYQWKQRVPNTKRLEMVADFFHVSIDYLLGRTDNPNNGLSVEQRQMSIDEALKSVMSSDGKPLTENDRAILAGLYEAYLEKKKD